jgi:TolB protein
MKTTIRICSIALFSAIFLGCDSTEDRIISNSSFSPYLSQDPPGTTPEVFAPGIVSDPESNEYSGTFSPDGMEYYFYRFSDSMPATIYCSKASEDEWTNPEPVDFSSGYAAYEPHITFDNRSLYFAWNRGSGLPGIWVTKRNFGNWSEPKYAGEGMFVSSNLAGNIYLTDMSSFASTGKTYLATVTLVDDTFTNYQRLTIGAHYGNQAHPCISPDGSYLLFDVQSGSYLYLSFKMQDGTWGEAIDLTKHSIDPLAGGATISPDGKYLFFCLNRDIWWVSTKIIDDLRPAQGVIAYAITPPDGNAEIFLMNADGSGKTKLTDQPGRPYGPAFSPDATKVAFYNHLTDQAWSLYLMNADGTNIQRLTNSQNTLDWAPDWSPDGQKIVFARSVSSPAWRSELWLINPDGSDLHRLGDVEGQGPHWSPDGSKIAYFNYVDGGGDIWIMNADGADPVKLTDNPSEDWWPQFSPDGGTIAFQSKRDGNFEIYVMNSDGGDPIRLTNNSADDEDPNWSPDGNKIAFISMRDGHYEIYTMNADGSNQSRITSTNGHAIDPEWKPIAIPPSVRGN